MCSFNRQKKRKTAQRLYPGLDEKGFVQTADFFSHALKKAAKTGFKKIILSCFFGKLCKWAMNMTYTHARSGLIDFDFLSQVAMDNGCSNEFSAFVKSANNARQIFESDFKDKALFIDLMGNMAVKNAVNMSGS
jgi:cobalamin biosynthesis protein CbiD